MSRRELTKILVWVDSTMASAERILAYAHRMSGTSSALEVNDLCSAAFDESRYRCECEGIDMQLNPADDLPPIHGHAGQLLCALAHVVRNSREAYARAESTHTDSCIILLWTHANGGGVIIRIGDEGPGIEPEMRERVSELACSRKATAEVTAGAGLPIARMIVRSHGGDLRLGESAKGTRIELELPAVSQAYIRRSILHGMSRLAASRSRA